MLSRIPENALVSLLRQCYVQPRCHVLQSHLRARQCRSLHTSGLCPHLRVCPQRETRAENSLFEERRGYWASYQQARPLLSTTLSKDNRQTRTLATTARSSQPPPASSPKRPSRDRIAILGSGITGLSSAHYLAKALPQAKIDIYEASSRIGGWLNSNMVDVENGEQILFELGPRTIRPNTPAGTLTVQLVKDLGLEDELLITPRDSDAARNRFVYYPDHLVKMPGPGQDVFQMAWTLMTELVFTGLLRSALEPIRPLRESTLEDESVGSFLERRLGSSSLGDNVVSAVLHGIYAGDLYKLSAKSLLPDFWYNELHYGSLATGVAEMMNARAQVMPSDDAWLTNYSRSKLEGTTISAKMKNASVYSFKKGISALSGALETSLKSNPNVQFKLGHSVNSIQYDKAIDGVRIKTTKNQPPQSYANVISTISGRSLSYCTEEADDLPSLQATKAVTVMVVNFFYRDPNILPERGFGYLIPRSIPYEQNPECALGVVFDSDAIKGQDKGFEVPGTKLTIMLGGHWWDDFDVYPDEGEAIAMAIAVVKRHLGIDKNPDVIGASLQKDCIPQYTVGHEARMRSAHGELQRTFNGKVSVAGNSYTGVGLNDCIRASWDVVAHLCQLESPVNVGVYADVSRRELGDLEPTTGLEKFIKTREWAGLRMSKEGTITTFLGGTQKQVTDQFKRLDLGS